MDVVIEACETMPCKIQTFKINDVDAELDDFGGVIKDSSDGYECTNLRFKESNYPPLEKYGISYSDYDEICVTLSDVLKIERCDWCT